MRLLLLISLLLPRVSYSQDTNANQWDKFSLTADRGCHIMGSFLTTYFGTELLKKAGMAKLPATLLSGFVSYTLWTGKEFYHDDFASSGDNTANLIGVGAGMLFTIPFGR